MEKSFLTIDKISAYKKSCDFSNEIWATVIVWDYFSKDTVGKQLVRAADSISANIAEGFGRYTKKDKSRFYAISLGSLEETNDWVRKSLVRKLISPENYKKYEERLLEIKKDIFHLIKFTNEKLKI